MGRGDPDIHFLDLDELDALLRAVPDGQRAILAHIYGREPATTSRVVVFHVHSTAGTYRTVLRGALPTVRRGQSEESLALRQ